MLHPSGRAVSEKPTVLLVVGTAIRCAHFLARETGTVWRFPQALAEANEVIAGVGRDTVVETRMTLFNSS